MMTAGSGLVGDGARRGFILRTVRVVHPTYITLT